MAACEPTAAWAARLMAAPLTRKGGATRDRIVATAAEMFRRQGVRGTSVEQVLASTGNEVITF